MTHLMEGGIVVEFVSLSGVGLRRRRKLGEVQRRICLGGGGKAGKG